MDQEGDRLIDRITREWDEEDASLAASVAATRERKSRKQSQGRESEAGSGNQIGQRKRQACSTEQDEGESTRSVLRRNQIGKQVRIAFEQRRTVAHKEEKTFVVYNESSTGRRKGYVPTIKQEWNKGHEGDVSLFGLHRAQWFSQRYPFIGHAPASDCSFDGLLSSLNVDRAREVSISPTKSKGATKRSDTKRENREKHLCIDEEEEDDIWLKRTKRMKEARVECSEDQERFGGDVVHMRAAVGSPARSLTPAIPYSPPKRWLEDSPLSPDGRSPRPDEAVDPSRWVPLTPERSHAIIDDESINMGSATPAHRSGLPFDVGGGASNSDKHDATWIERQVVLGNGATGVEDDDVCADDIPRQDEYWLAGDIDKRQAWIGLEDALLAFVNDMKEQKTFGGNTWLLESGFFRPPHSFGYRSITAVTVEAEKCMRRARAAFHALIAVSRMYVEAFRSHYATATRPAMPSRREIEDNTVGAVAVSQVDAVWTRYLHEKCPHIPLHWLRAIINTSVGMDSPGRAGSFVDLRDVYVLEVVLYHITLGMPVYIVCSKTMDWIRELDQVDKVRVLSLILRQSEDPSFFVAIAHPDHCTTTGASGHEDRLAIDDGNWTLPEEGVASAASDGKSEKIGHPSRPIDLLHSHAVDLNRLELSDDPIGTQLRCSREQSSRAQQAPGTSMKSATCFVWEPDDKGCLHRVRVERANVANVWIQYNWFSRKYLSAWHQWDLWHGYDCRPDGTYPAHDADEDFYDHAVAYDVDRLEECQRPLSYTLNIAATASPSNDKAVYERQIQAEVRRLERLQSQNVLGHVRGCSTIAERAKKYFGFTAGAKWILKTRFRDEDVRLTVLKMFEVPEWQDKLEAHTLTNVHRLVLDIEAAAGSPTCLDPRLCDMHPDHPDTITRRNGQYLHVEIRMLTLTEPLETDQSPPTKKRRKLPTASYFIRPRGESLRYVVAVVDPLVALRALRWSGSLRDLVYELLTSGVKVALLRPFSSPLPPSCVPCPLPILSTDTVEECDYRLYKMRLHAMIRRNTHMKLAAIKKGGIIWRLVVQLVDVRDTLDSISEMGSSPAFEGASVSDMPIVFDDDLTTEEERTICGIYDSSTITSLHDDTMWSWWPRASIWEQSSVCAGQWTMYNENWFLTREAKLERGDLSGELKTSNQWRRLLEGQKKRGDRFVRSSRELASRVLDGI